MRLIFERDDQTVAMIDSALPDSRADVKKSNASGEPWFLFDVSITFADVTVVTGDDGSPYLRASSLLALAMNETPGPPAPSIPPVIEVADGLGVSRGADASTDYSQIEDAIQGVLAKTGPVAVFPTADGFAIESVLPLESDARLLLLDALGGKIEFYSYASRA